MAEKRIQLLKNGPYQVTGGVPVKVAAIVTDGEGTSIRWKTGRAYEGGETVALCRCGHSANKPFCDGAHLKNGFVGEERAEPEGYMRRAVRYSGETIDIVDDESLCASMRFCDRGPRAWNAAINSGDPENRRIAIEECADCAAGRLTAVEKDGTPIEPQLEMEIGLVQDTAMGRRGPLWVKGGIPIEGENGAYEVRNRVTLCRCGESKNMPFCDISHMRCTHMEGFDE